MEKRRKKRELVVREPETQTRFVVGLVHPRRRGSSSSAGRSIARFGRVNERASARGPEPGSEESTNWTQDVATNETFATNDAKLKSGDVIAAIPLVAGG